LRIRIRISVAVSGSAFKYGSRYDTQKLHTKKNLKIQNYYVSKSVVDPYSFITDPDPEFDVGDLF
jgi:hypothetical protein